MKLAAGRRRACGGARSAGLGRYLIHDNSVFDLQRYPETPPDVRQAFICFGASPTIRRQALTTTGEGSVSFACLDFVGPGSLSLQ